MRLTLTLVGFICGLFPLFVLTQRVKATGHPSALPKVAAASVHHFVVGHHPAPGLKWWHSVVGLTP